jgi:hypothetical protein
LGSSFLTSFFGYYFLGAGADVLAAVVVLGADPPPTDPTLPEPALINCFKSIIYVFELLSLQSIADFGDFSGIELLSGSLEDVGNGIVG